VFLAAEDVWGFQVVPDEPILHLLQQQGRLGRGQFGRVDGVDDLVPDAFDALDEVERGRAAAEETEHGVGGWDLHGVRFLVLVALRIQGGLPPTRRAASVRRPRKTTTSVLEIDTGHENL
jgi:hypothetical protein